METIENLFHSNPYITFVLTLVIGFLIGLISMHRVVFGILASFIGGYITITLLHLHLEPELGVLLLGIFIYIIGFLSGSKYTESKLLLMDPFKPKNINTTKNIVSRSFEVNNDSTVVDKTLLQLNEAAIDVSFELTLSQNLDKQQPDMIAAGDIVTITGPNNALYYYDDNIIGTEIAIDDSNIIETTFEYVIKPNHLVGLSLKAIKKMLNANTDSSVCITALARNKFDMLITPDLITEEGDHIQLVGKSNDIERVQQRLIKL